MVLVSRSFRLSRVGEPWMVVLQLPSMKEVAPRRRQRWVVGTELLGIRTGKESVQGGMASVVDSPLQKMEDLVAFLFFSYFAMLITLINHTLL